MSTQLATRSLATLSLIVAPLILLGLALGNILQSTLLGVMAALMFALVGVALYSFIRGGR